MEAQITGIGEANVQFTEYLSLNMLNQYTSAITPLQTVFTTPSADLTSSDYDTITNAIANLKNLALNGVTDNNGSENYQSYMNQEMVTYLNQIMSSFQFAGIPPADGSTPTAAQKVQLVQNWQNLQNIGSQIGLPSFGINVQSYLTNALGIINTASQYTLQTTSLTTGLAENLVVQAFPGRSLQSALELEYVSTANQAISTQLGALQSALTISQQILLTLTETQNTMNEITVNAKVPAFTPPLKSNYSDANSYTSAYEAAASAYFSQVFPSATPAITAVSQLISYKSSIMSQLNLIVASNPSPTAAISYPGSFANTCYQVALGISAAFSAVLKIQNPTNAQLLSAVKNYILDGQNTVTSTIAVNANSNPIQTNLSNAITAASTLEENQRESVTQYIFVFQEFYKTTASILTAIEALFQKITQNIQ